MKLKFIEVLVVLLATALIATPIIALHNQQPKKGRYLVIWVGEIKFSDHTVYNKSWTAISQPQIQGSELFFTTDAGTCAIPANQAIYEALK